MQQLQTAEQEDATISKRMKTVLMTNDNDVTHTQQCTLWWGIDDIHHRIYVFEHILTPYKVYNRIHRPSCDFSAILCHAWRDLLADD
jgi:hypothetical protein